MFNLFNLKKTLQKTQAELTEIKRKYEETEIAISEKKAKNKLLEQQLLISIIVLCCSISNNY